MYVYVYDVYIYIYMIIYDIDMFTSSSLLCGLAWQQKETTAMAPAPWGHCLAQSRHWPVFSPCLSMPSCGETGLIHRFIHWLAPVGECWTLHHWWYYCVGDTTIVDTISVNIYIYEPLMLSQWLINGDYEWIGLKSYYWLMILDDERFTSIYAYLC